VANTTRGEPDFDIFTDITLMVPEKKLYVLRQHKATEKNTKNTGKPGQVVLV